VRFVTASISVSGVTGRLQGNTGKSLKLEETLVAEKISACFLFHAGFLFGLFFKPEEGGNMSFRLSLDFMALYPKRQTSS
jgi:hypothetical protein